MEVFLGVQVEVLGTQQYKIHVKDRTTSQVVSYEYKEPVPNGIVRHLNEELVRMFFSRKFGMFGDEIMSSNQSFDSSKGMKSLIVGGRWGSGAYGGPFSLFTLTDGATIGEYSSRIAKK